MSPFPREGTPREQLLFALEAGVLAPSGHNSQPWLFRMTGEGVEILADRRRRLPVIDPQDRELVISCGAVLFNLRVALEAHGCGARFELLPEPEQPDLMARVRLAEPPDESRVGRLWPAVARRYTHRLPFTERPVELNSIWALQEAACSENCRFLPLTGDLRHEAIGLIGEVDIRLATDPGYRRALQSWLTTHMAQAEAPVVEGFEVTLLDEFVAMLPRLLMQFHGNGSARAYRDQELARKSPLLVLIAGSGDTPCHWMQAGQALQRVLLEGVEHGLQASYLNQPLELPDSRNWLARWTSGSVPHLLLRMGYPEKLLKSPARRPLAEFLVD